jgi:hypothetical protein
MVKLLHHGCCHLRKSDIPTRPYQPIPGVGIGSRALIDWNTVSVET